VAGGEGEARAVTRHRWRRRGARAVDAGRETADGFARDGRGGCDRWRRRGARRHTPSLEKRSARAVDARDGCVRAVDARETIVCVREEVAAHRKPLGLIGTTGGPPK
jgi:hypothetical protein